nr:hypothetical protein [uncultured bacterium]
MIAEPIARISAQRVREPNVFGIARLTRQRLVRRRVARQHFDGQRLPWPDVRLAGLEVEIHDRAARVERRKLRIVQRPRGDHVVADAHADRRGDTAVDERRIARIGQL